MTDAFEMLAADHQEVKRVLAQFESGAGDPAQLAETLVVEESKHEAVEEMYFWPSVREKVPGGDRLAETALGQEREGKEVLEALRKAEPGQPEFMAAIATFIKAGRAHIAFEEEQVWPELRRALSAGESAELGEKLEKAKTTSPTRPHPGGPDSPGGLKTAGVAAAATDKLRDAVSRRG
ncbi:MAG: hemerythrin domain-containing protein [Acidimicrobiales bacterium]